MSFVNPFFNKGIHTANLNLDGIVFVIIHVLNKSTRTGPMISNEFFSIFVGIFELPDELLTDISLNALLSSLLNNWNQTLLFANCDGLSILWNCYKFLTISIQHIKAVIYVVQTTIMIFYWIWWDIRKKSIKRINSQIITNLEIVQQ